MNAQQMKDLCANDTTVMAINGNQEIADYLNRQLQYGQAKTTVSADGDPSAYVLTKPDWIPGWAKRLAVMTLIDEVAHATETNEDGTARLFRPSIFPFHVNAEGEPLTQIRFFIRSPKSTPEKKYPQQYAEVRLEEYGYEAAIDAAIAKQEAEAQVQELPA